MSAALPSDLDLWVLELVRTYCTTPRKALKRIKTLWNDCRGSILDETDELSGMLYSLHLFFGDNDGRVTQNGQVIGTVEGALWNAILAEKFPILLMDFFRDASFVKQPTVWVSSVLGVSAGFATLWRHHAHPHAAQFSAIMSPWPMVPSSLAKQYFQEMGSVWDVLWKEKDTLLSEKGHPNAFRFPFYTEAILRLMSFYYTSLEYRSELTKCKSIIGVALSGWIYSAVSPKPIMPDVQEHLAFEVVLLYLDWTPAPSGWDVGYFQQTAVSTALDGIGASKFMKACYDAISSWPHMVGVNLRSCLEALHRMVSFDQDMNSEWFIDTDIVSRKAFWALDMLDAVAKALERQNRPAEDSISILKQPAAHLSIFKTSLQLIRFTTMSFIVLRESPPVAHGRSVYKILSICMLSLGRSLGSGYQGSHFDIMRNVLQGLSSAAGKPAVTPDSSLASITTTAADHFRATCTELKYRFRDRTVQNSTHTQALERLLQEVQAAASESWYTDLCEMRTLQDQHGGDKNYVSLVQSWLIFGEAAGLKEAAERDRHDTQQKYICAWIGCALHKQPSPTELRACMGCRKQRYCSRECQTKDWKEGGHRRACQKSNV